MQREKLHSSHAQSSWKLMAMASVSCLLVGCACSEADWQEHVSFDQSGGDCDFDSIDRQSDAAAALAKSADPLLLEQARRDAMRACAKARQG